MGVGAPCRTKLCEKMADTATMCKKEKKQQAESGQWQSDKMKKFEKSSQIFSKSRWVLLVIGLSLMSRI